MQGQAQYRFRSSGLPVLCEALLLYRVDDIAREQVCAQRRWVGVRVRTVLPERSQATADQSGATTVAGAMSGQHEEGDVGRVMWEYTEAKRRLDALVNEADKLGERFNRLAHGLSAHPRRMIIGLRDRFADDATEWDVVPIHPLPRIESLVTLANDIREAALKVDDLRERLILMDRADLVEQPDGFFH
jgi:hypothetical protein